MPSKRRVVITGLGLVTPVGTGVEPVWEALVAGRNGTGRITKFEFPPDFPVQIAAEVKDFRAEEWIDPKEVRRNDTFIHYAIACTAMAIKDAAFVITPANADRVAVAVSSGIGGLPWIERTVKDMTEKGHKKVSPFFIPGVIINLAPGQISIAFGAKGPNLSVVTACATATHSIGQAYRMIQYGDADAAIAGGADAVVCPIAIAGFAAMRALSTRNDAPERASRPWDKDRDGFVLGEGGGVFILESLEAAQARGAKIYAEITGFGMSGDAFHISAPSEDGDGPFRCMQAALRDAGAAPAEVEYLNAHGTSTPAGDRIETLAVKRLFGDRARDVQIHSTKSMIGHLLGAAGAVETAVAALTLQRGVVHPTINLENPDPECDLNYTPNTAVKREVRIALKNSFGFGGTNASLVLRKWEGR
jgi:3-oxoacyl-[acyl-carrier-protein] synthase II